MGVYIPNMSKPKGCKECQWHLDFYIEDEQVGGLCTITEKDDKENTCPLIEIVRCGECKHRDPEDKKCDCGMFERQGCIFPVADDYFCKYGERRSDVNNT